MKSPVPFFGNNGWASVTDGYLMVNQPVASYNHWNRSASFGTRERERFPRENFRRKFIAVEFGKASWLAEMLVKLILTCQKCGDRIVWFESENSERKTKSHSAHANRQRMKESVPMNGIRLKAPPIKMCPVKMRADLFCVWRSKGELNWIQWMCR